MPGLPKQGPSDATSLEGVQPKEAKAEQHGQRGHPNEQLDVEFVHRRGSIQGRWGSIPRGPSHEVPAGAGHTVGRAMSDWVAYFRGLGLRIGFEAHTEAASAGSTSLRTERWLGVW